MKHVRTALGLSVCGWVSALILGSGGFAQTEPPEREPAVAAPAECVDVLGEALRAVGERKYRRVQLVHLAEDALVNQSNYAEIFSDLQNIEPSQGLRVGVADNVVSAIAASESNELCVPTSELEE